MPYSPPMAEKAETRGIDSRIAAVNILDAVLRRGAALDDTLAASRAVAALETRDRAFARLQIATALRRLGQIDTVIAAFLDRPLPASASATRNILRLGAVQLLVLETPAHAVVDNAVRLCERVRQPRFKGLVNAVLRRVAREGRAIFDAADAARINTPDWLWHSWSAEYGEAACRAIAEAHLAEPPLDITVKEDAARWAERLGGTMLATGAVRLRDAGDVTRLDGFADGAWWVQDAAAALPARLLLSAVDAGDTPTIIDLCAAPGGKTAQLAAAGAHVVAVDRSSARLDRLRENLARLALAADIIEADAASWQPATSPAGVLLDAPCTATGTIRRHPDIARTKQPEDVARLAPIQGRLLENAIAMLPPGGIAVYSVCSLQPEEGPGVVNALLAAHDDIARLPVAPQEIDGIDGALTDDGDVRTLPLHSADAGGMDGFYIARLLRRA